jgi:hypothetical protein
MHAYICKYLPCNTFVKFILRTVPVRHYKYSAWPDLFFTCLGFSIYERQNLQRFSLTQGVVHTGLQASSYSGDVLENALSVVYVRIWNNSLCLTAGNWQCTPSAPIVTVNEISQKLKLCPRVPKTMYKEVAVFLALTGAASEFFKFHISQNFAKLSRKLSMANTVQQIFLWKIPFSNHTRLSLDLTIKSRKGQTYIHAVLGLKLARYTRHDMAALAILEKFPINLINSPIGVKFSASYGTRCTLSKKNSGYCHNFFYLCIETVKSHVKVHFLNNF